MGLISKNDDCGETLKNLINSSELNGRVLYGGTLVGTEMVSGLSPAERKLASMLSQGVRG